MSSVRLYHNAGCSKSRATLALLREHGIEPDVIDYLSQPPSEATLHELAHKLGDPHALLRTKESAYEAAQLDQHSSLAQIVAAIQRAPILLERPIVVRGERAVIGRPPENVLTLL